MDDAMARFERLQSGRDAAGRFGVGNKISPGRRPRCSETRYLAAMTNQVSLDDWAEIIAVAVDAAKSGDAKARLFLAAYLIGKPVNRDAAPLDVQMDAAYVRRGLVLDDTGHDENPGDNAGDDGNVSAG